MAAVSTRHGAEMTGLHVGCVKVFYRLHLFSCCTLKDFSALGNSHENEQKHQVVIYE